MTALIPMAALTAALGVGFPAPVVAQIPAERVAQPVHVAAPRAEPALPTPDGMADHASTARIEPGDGLAVGSVPDDSSPEVYAQRRGGHGGRGGGRGGASRGAPVVYRGPVHASGVGGGPWGGPPVYWARPYYYDPFWASGAFGWSPMFYAPWSLMWGTAGFGPYPAFGPTTFNTGAVRLKMRPRDAQVYVDGFLAGVVDDFDGVFQSLRLAPGGHTIEVRMPGFQTRTLDVHIQPGRTMTLKEGLEPATP